MQVKSSSGSKTLTGEFPVRFEIINILPCYTDAMNEVTEEMALSLTNWYQKNKRTLPWRDTDDPYAVWVSEIMLQQTRIEAVIPKYQTFMNELPAIPTLADCPEDHLMRLWEGLGYYSRARNLQKCARILVRDYHGKLPQDYPALVSLPGIGPYTAGAIASLAFDQPVMAVDGNVLRILSRLSEDTRNVRDPSVKKELSLSIQPVYSLSEYPGFFRDFNEGLMELGETVCLPKGTPDCAHCPWQMYCWANLHHNFAMPYLAPLQKRRIEKRTLLIIRDEDGNFLLHKRPDTGLLADLYEFIGIDGYVREDDILKLCKVRNLVVMQIQELPASIHVFSHLEWHMHAYEITVEMIPETPSDYTVCTKKEMADLAIPSAFAKYKKYYSLR